MVRIIIKNLSKCNILNTFALKNNRRFAEHNFKKLCPLSLALTIPVLGLERACARKVGPWPWPRIFFEFLASKVVSSTLIFTAVNAASVEKLFSEKKT